MNAPADPPRRRRLADVPALVLIGLSVLSLVARALLLVGR